LQISIPAPAATEAAPAKTVTPPVEKEIIGELILNRDQLCESKVVKVKKKLENSKRKIFPPNLKIFFELASEQKNVLET
jgi:hypothetical protein